MVVKLDVVEGERDALAEKLVNADMDSASLTVDDGDGL